MCTSISIHSQFTTTTRSSLFANFAGLHQISLDHHDISNIPFTVSCTLSRGRRDFIAFWCRTTRNTARRLDDSGHVVEESRLSVSCDSALPRHHIRSSLQLPPTLFIFLPHLQSVVSFGWMIHRSTHLLMFRY